MFYPRAHHWVPTGITVHNLYAQVFRHFGRLQVITGNSNNSFIVLFAPGVIGQIITLELVFDCHLKTALSVTLTNRS